MFERLANLATKAGVEGAGLRIRAPLLKMSKADIVREGMRLGVDFSQTVSCRPRRRPGPRLRPLRRLPAALGRLRRCRHHPSHPLRLISHTAAAVSERPTPAQGRGFHVGR